MTDLLLAALLLVLSVMADVLVSSIVYHRYLSHRSVDLNKWLARGLALFLQSMAFAPPLTFVASHRAHHAHTDSVEDPYSPVVHGFWRVLFLTPVLVTRWRQKRDAETLARLCRRIPDERWYAACDRTWICLAISMSGVAAFFIIFGWLGLVLYAFQLWGYYLVGGWVNAVAHTFGTRPHDNSGVNRGGLIPWLVNVCIWGEWLHNYHHHRPGSPNFGLGGEVDTGYLVCRALATVGLASLRDSSCPLEVLQPT
jgi:stearoyl-CoA desaturase (delta-9 desaturase)